VALRGAIATGLLVAGSRDTSIAVRKVILREREEPYHGKSTSHQDIAVLHLLPLLGSFSNL
jgi:hypothetical protein